MATKVGLLALVLFTGLSTAAACILRPGGCQVTGSNATCKWLPTTYPSTSANYSLASTWSASNVKGMAYYLGVYNKLASSPPELAKPISYDTWKSTRSYPFFYNLEKFPLESGFVISSEVTSLRECCSKCSAMDGCILYLYRPTSTSSNAPLTGGTCYYLKGGSYQGDGPFATATAIWGSPDAGTHSEQASGRTKSNPLGYLGGFCNPGAKVVDDPHFTGAHGTRFDFNGELNKVYCLVSDKHIHINAVLKGYKSSNTFHASLGSDGKATRSWIKEVGIVWADALGAKHSLKLTARPGKEQARGRGFLASAELDAAPLAAPLVPGSAAAAGDMSLTFLGTSKQGWYDVDSYNVKVGEKLDLYFDLRVAHPKLQSPTDAEVHFNLMFSALQVSENVHGVLGQTYRNSPKQIAKAIKFSELGRLLGAPVQADGASGKGFLEGVVSDYVASSVVAPDCKMSAFSQ